MNEPTDHDSAGDAVLEVVAQTLPRVDRSRPETSAIGLDSQLDSGLGFESLDRAELLVNVEHRFGVELPDGLLNNAQTPRDILNAVLRARGEQPAESGTASRENTGTPAQRDAYREHFTLPPFETLQQALLWHARKHPRRTYLHWITSDADIRPLNFGELHHGSLRIANGLFRHNLAMRDTVALMLPTSHDYFYGFFGVLYANAIPVPLPPPAQAAQLEEHLQEQAAILNDAEARIMITVPEAKRLATRIKTLVPSLEHLVTTEDLWGNALMHPVASADGAHTAVLQYRSGSSAIPEATQLSHANVFARINAHTEALGVDQDDVFVSWLPLHHEMGLIGTGLSSLWLGLHLVVMSPFLFLARPRHWLWAIHHFGGTLSASPDFGYDLCLHHLTDEDLDGIDLSSWRMAFTGREAVSGDTMAQFSRRFAAWGFSPETITAVDSLAENRVDLAFRGAAPTRLDKALPLWHQKAILGWRRIRKHLYASWAWFAFGLTGLMTLVGVNILPRRNWRWRVAHFGGRVLGWLTGTRLDVTGGEKLKRLPQGCVVVANHASYADVPVIAALMPVPVSFVAKSELRRFAFLRRLFRLLDVESVDRSTDQSKVRASRRIAARAQGRRLLYFAEGSFDAAPGIQPFHMGAFMTAAFARQPILPIALKGTRQKLPADRWNPRPGAVEVVVGNLLWPDGNDWDSATQLRERTRRAIVAMTDEPDRLARLQPGEFHSVSDSHSSDD